MRKRFVVLIASVLFSISQGRALAQSNPAPVQVVFKAQGKSFLLGQPVILECEIRDLRPEAVTIDLGADRLTAFTFSAIQTNGVVDKGPPPIGGIVALGMITIKTNEPYRQQIILDQLLISESIGVHEIDCGLKLRNTTVGNRVSIEITPANDEQLRAYIQSMEKRIEGTRYKDESLFLERALSFVHSAAVVPDLKKVVEAQAKLGLYEVLKAFRRIGGPSARQALLDLTKSQNQELAVKAGLELKLLDAGITRDIAPPD